MADLLPCPFCGADGEEVALCYETGQTPQTGSDWFVRCYVCHVETARQDGRGEAIAAWNCRASPASPAHAHVEGPGIPANPDIGGET